MIKILQYFILIRFRKLIPKDDFFGIFLLVMFHISVSVLLYYNFEYFKSYIFLFFIEPVFIHFNRDDFELLKIKKNYKTLIFIEYLIYCLPFYIVLLLKNKFLLTASILIFFTIFIAIPKVNFKTIKYPFQLFNPFWHICFRKYKLILALPFVTGLIVISKFYNNENLIYFSFFILSLICCSPSFERESLDEIKINPFDAKKYLFCQFKNSIINTSYLLIPVIITLAITLKFSMILISLIILIIPLINIILKYVYFYNSFMHQISFIFFSILSFTLYGLPLLLMPILNKKAINNINSIKYANH